MEAGLVKGDMERRGMEGEIGRYNRSSKNSTEQPTSWSWWHKLYET